MIAGQLEIQLLTNIARLQSDMNQAKSVIGGTVRDIERVMGRLQQVFLTGTVATMMYQMVQQTMFAEQAVNRLDAVIRATGNASGFTAKQLHSMADAMAEVSQFDDEDIRNATANLLRFGNIHGQTLTKALKLSADFAAFTGTDMASAADSLGKALASPAQGIERLQRQIGYLNPGQVEGIKLMQEMGDLAGAQAALFDILQRKIGGVAEQMNTGYTKAYQDAKKAIGEFVEALGNSAAVQVPVQSFLKFVTDSMRDMKHIIEDGDWVQALKFILGFRQTDEQAAARRVSGGDPVADQRRQQDAMLEQNKAFRAALADQDEKANAHLMRLAKERAEAEQKARVTAAEAELAAEEMFARDYAEAWKWADHYRTEEERKESAERLAIAQAEMDARQMALDDFIGAWQAYDAFVRRQDKAMLDDARAQWGGFIDGIESAFREGWNKIGESWKDALGTMRNAFQRILLDFIYQSLAKPLVLSLVATVAQSAGLTGLSTMATSAMGSAASAAFGAEGIAGVLGSIGPVGWGLLAAGAVAAVVSYIRSRGGGPKEEGEGGAIFSASGARLGATSGYDIITGSGMDAQFQDLGTSTAEAFFAALRRLGGSIGGDIAFHFAAALDPKGDAANILRTAVSVGGRSVYDGAIDAGRPEDFEAQITLETKRALLAALKASDLPEAIAAIFVPLDALSASAAQIDAALAAAEAMAQIIDALAGLDIAGLDIDALKAFQRDGEALGDTLSRVAGLWSQYQSAFLTDAEKLAMAQGAVTDTFSRLGVAVPDSMEAFKALVGGLDLSTEAGRTMWEALMEVAPAFAAVATAATDAAEASRRAAAAMLSSFDSVMGQLRGSGYTQGIQRMQLDSALGQFQAGNAWSAGLSLDALMGQLLTITREDFQNYSADMQGLITQILGLYAALNSGTETVGTLTTAIQDFDNSAQVALQRRGLEARILELQGDDFLALTRRRELELEAMDESLRPLQLLIWGLEDQARLAEEAARAAEELARAERALIDRRADLTERLVELADGPEAARFMRRMRELAEETDPASRALLERIWLLEDEAEKAKQVTDAMRETVAAMEQVASFRSSLGASILSIRSAMAGFDAVGYHSGQVTSARAALGSATDLQGRLTAAGGLRDAIMARYQAEVDAINATHQAQSDAARAAIDAANELNRAFRNLGDYAKSMLTGELSTLSPDQKLAESGRQYQEILARARGGDVMALGQLQGAASNYLGQARGFYASSDAYVRIFGEVQGALAELGARAGPDQVFQENTAAWQSSLLDVQTRAIAELESLDAMTELWQRELQDTLEEQAIAFTELNLTSYQIEEHLRDLPQQIRDAINAATAALSQVIVSTGRAQSEENSDAIDGQNTVLMSIPFRVNGGVAVTERR